MKSQSKEKIDDSKKWPDIKSKDLRQVIKKHQSQNEKTSLKRKEDIDIITDDSYRDTIIEKIKLEADKSDSPETIDIEKPGKYKIDRLPEGQYRISSFWDLDSARSSRSGLPWYSPRAARALCDDW